MESEERFKAIVVAHDMTKMQLEHCKELVAQATSGSAIAERPRDVLVSRNSATTKYPYRVALFA